ncbi:hypothetical protein EDC94DRAFT_643735 [Helicostylum pulchrum]|nr:hypothetical protein EDC94DRAFT_643735 [Helicostylum pulchrum]
MDKVHDFHRHTHCVIMHIGKTDVSAYVFFTSSIHFKFPITEDIKLGPSISYDKQRTYVNALGSDCAEEDEDNIVVDNFHDKLYDLFKKDKATWDEEDTFLMKEFPVIYL